MSDEEAVVLEYLWTFWARDEQLPPQDDEWVTWLILAGRGFGKTRSGAEWVRSLVESGEYGRIALVAEDAGDARDVMVEGESGIIAVCPPWNKPKYEPSKKRITWPNGARATIFSADDPEALRGPQHDAAWADELAKWRYAREAYDQLQFGLRLGRRPVQCITTTPRVIPVLKEIIKDPRTRISRGSTYDNADNLAPTFREKIIGRYEGTRLGRQELMAEMLDDNPFALWNPPLLESLRVSGHPELRRIVVAVDPPVTSGENADECGIIVAGTDHDKNCYVLDDGSCQGLTPEKWGREVVRRYYGWDADAVVVEVNNGGELVSEVIRHIDDKVPVIEVRASRGKVTRAEPVSTLYERGRVKHVGYFAQLEDQMCDFTSDFDRKRMGYSPDRVDALVWAITELALKKSNYTLAHL